MENLQNKNFRYERKFFISNVNRKVVESYINRLDYFFSEIYHERMINNIYFDYPQFNNFKDNVDGNTNRIKYRIRWYGEMLSNIPKPVLELKIKKGSVGTKESYPISTFDIYKGIQAHSLKKVILKSEINTLIKDRIKNQNPVIFNRYRRKYFQSADKKFRITIDDQQSFFKIKPLDNNFLNCHQDLSNIIIELKYNIPYNLEANRVMSNIPFLLTKSSKYARAIELLYQ